MISGAICTMTCLVSRFAGWCFVLLSLLAICDAYAHSYVIKSIEIDHPYARVSPPGAQNGAVYFRGFQNSGSVGDKLISASSPVAERIELHKISTEGGVMRMREVKSIPIMPGERLFFEHNNSHGHHLMLVNLKSNLKDGDRFRLSLQFERSGQKEVIVYVQSVRNGESKQHHRH